MGAKHCPKSYRILPVFVFSLLIASYASADTIYFKNKNVLEGVIEKETEKQVELNLGFGTMVFSKSEIQKIERADATKTQEIWNQWGQEKKERKEREPEEEKQRIEREAATERARAADEKRKRDADESIPKDIEVITQNQAIIVNALINGKARVNLILDSGAGNVTLNKSVADKLGLDLETLPKSSSIVADGRTAEVAMVTLSEIRIQNPGVVDAEGQTPPVVTAQNVKASVLTQGVEAVIPPGGGGVRPLATEGLLGMSFLKNFIFHTDYENKKVTFSVSQDNQP